MSCPPLRLRFPQKEIGIWDATNGLNTAQTKVVEVKGISPLLAITIAAYWRKSTAPTGCTWALAPLARDQLTGAWHPLQSIFTARTLPDGWELCTGAEGFRATYSLIANAAGNADGQMVVDVTACPMEEMSPATLEKLYAAVTVDFPQPALMKYP